MNSISSFAFLIFVAMILLLSSDSNAQIWTAQTSGTNYDLGGINFYDLEHGWAVGTHRQPRGGAVVRTTSGGREWIVYETLGGVDLNDVQFIDNTYGWITCIGGFSETTNGGIDWNNFNVPSGLTHVTDVHFIDRNSTWVVGYISLGDIGYFDMYQTKSRGRTWTSPIYYPSVENHIPNNIMFVDNDYGWFEIDSLVVRTTDGGTSWIEYNMGFQTTDFCFVDRNNGWTVGFLGEIANTIDGGVTWSLRQSGTQSYLSSVTFTNRFNGWVVGVGGLILHTTDGGTTWSRQESGVTTDLYNIDFSDERHVWACGRNGTMLVYTDTTTLPALSLRIPNKTTSYLKGTLANIVWSNDTTVQSVNIDLNRNYPDGVWERIASNVANVNSYQWIALGATTHTARIRISDAVNQAVGDTSLRNFAIIDHLLALTFPVHRWDTVSVRSTVIRWFTDVDDTSHAILKFNADYPNGTWNDIGLAEASACSLVWMLPESLQTNRARLCISLLSDSTITDTSDYNFVVVDVKQRDTELSVNSFQILSTFPNPFNSSTTLTYSIPSREFIEVKLFDVTGREVKSLYQGNRTPGIYQLSIDGSGLSSGVYFCRLTAGSQSATQKLLLLR